MYLFFVENWIKTPFIILEQFLAYFTVIWQTTPVCLK